MSHVYIMTVAGVERECRLGTLNIREVANGINNAMFTILSSGGVYRPSLIDEIGLTCDGDKIYGGYIDKAAETGADGEPIDDIETRLECVDFNVIADRRFITTTIPAGTTLKNALNTYILPYYSTYGVTLEAGQLDGPNLPDDIVLVGVKGSEALNRLSVASGGWGWNFSYTKKLGMVQPGTVSCPFNVVDGDGHHFGDIQVDRQQNKRVNFVTLKYGQAQIIDKTDTFVGDGATDDWELTYPMLYSPRVGYGYVTDDGVFKTLALETDSEGDYRYDPTTNRLRRTAGNLGVGIILTIRYDVQFPQVVTASDPSDISLNGLFEALFEEPNIWDKGEATTAAEDRLSVNADPLETVRINTREVGAHPNQTLTVTAADRSVSGIYLITEVSIVSPGNDFDFVYRLTCIDTDRFRGSFRDVYVDWLKTGSSSAAVPAASNMGAFPGAPEWSVQFNKGGLFGGSDQFTVDPDGSQGTLGYSVLPSLAKLLVPDDDKYALIIGRSDATAANRVMGIWPYGPDGQIQIDMYGKVLWFVGKHAGLGSSGQFQLSCDSHLLLQADQANGIINTDGFTGAAGLGLFRRNLANSDSPYTISATERSTFFSCDATAGNITINAPAIAGNWTFAGLNNSYSRLVVIKHTGSANSVIFDPNSTETIDGNSTVTLAPGEAVIALAGGSGTQWRIIGRLAANATPAGSDKQVQFNDSGALGAHAGLTFDKTKRQLSVDLYDSSAIRLTNNGTTPSIMAFTPQGGNEYAEMAIGRETIAAVDTARSANPSYFWGHSGFLAGVGGVGMEVNTAETPAAAMTYAKGVGLDVTGDGRGFFYQYGGLGTGAVPGLRLRIERNDSGNGAAGCLSLQDKAGTEYFLWVEGGKLRIHTAPPTEDNTTVSHTAGTVVGTQT